MISRLTVLVAIFAVPTTTTSSLTFAASSHHDALKDTSSTWGAGNQSPATKGPAKTVCRPDGGRRQGCRRCANLFRPFKPAA